MNKRPRQYRHACLLARIRQKFNMGFDADYVDAQWRLRGLEQKRKQEKAA